MSVMVVSTTPPAIAGSMFILRSRLGSKLPAIAATKMVTIETGLQVKVPIFIKEGERIMVNIETREYVERVNK